MPTIPESGLQITLPTGMFFRFQDIPAYQQLSGFNLKEMDFGWWNSTTNTLWLFEVKDYSLLSSRERLPQHLLDTLEQKVVDSLMILGAVWSETICGQAFRTNLPSQFHAFPQAPPRADPRIKIAIVLKLNRPHIVSDLPALKDALNARLRGKVSLFDVRYVHLWDHNTARNLGGLPIS